MIGLDRLSPPMAAVAAALHAESGFHESWDAAAFAALLAAGADGLIACADDDPAGLVLWRVAADEAEILTICTAPNRRRLGVARQLLDAAARDLAARGVVRLFLEVAVDNDAAIALYRGFGVVEAGRRRGYYVRGCVPVDALVMALPLGRVA